MRQILSAILIFFLSACSDTKDNWQRQSSNFRDRGLLFMFYGSETLDESSQKTDLFWGQSVNLTSFFVIRPKQEHLISECVVDDKKLYSQFGNITFVKNQHCPHGSLFDDRLVSNKQGGSNPSQALIIPTIENHYEIFDDLSSTIKSRWFRLHYQQKANLLIEAKSSVILDGRLYLDTNRNDKVEKNELVDILTVDNNPQQIISEIEPGTYFFQITNDAGELPLDPKADNNYSMQNLESFSEADQDILKSSNPPQAKGLILNNSPTKNLGADNSQEKKKLNLSVEKLKSTFKLRFSTKYPPSYSDVGGGNNETAFILKTSEGPVSVNDSIGIDDQVDFYKFELYEPKSLQIKLETLAGLGDADLELYRDLNADGKTSSDELVNVSQGTGIDSLFIPFAAQGTWYVKIVAYQGELTYHLAIRTAETNSSDLEVNSEKSAYGLTLQILNLGPSDATDVRVRITLSEGQQILTEHPISQSDKTGNYLMKFSQISKGEKPSFIVTGESGSVVMVEVESKLPDSDTSNNALVKKL